MAKALNEKPHLLMCEPTAYDLLYEINAWMHISQPPNRAEAWHQWQLLHDTLKNKVGCRITLVRQKTGCPDMVFTANAGIVVGNKVIVSRFRHEERRIEEPHFRSHFASEGYSIVELPGDHPFEGEGDALFADDTLVLAHGKRTAFLAHAEVAAALSTKILSVRLVDERWYHLDTCFLPLHEGLICFYPPAFDVESQNAIRAHFDTIELNEVEALRFGCNTVVCGKSLVMPSDCPELAATLATRGYTVYPIPMSEFLKSGGACKCLTLYL